LVGQSEQQFELSRLGRSVLTNIGTGKDWDDIAFLLEYPDAAKVFKDVWSIGNLSPIDDTPFLQWKNLMGSNVALNPIVALGTNTTFPSVQPYQNNATMGTWCAVGSSDGVSQEFALNTDASSNLPTTNSICNSMEVQVSYPQLVKTTMRDVMDPDKIMLRELVPMQTNTFPGA